MMVSPISQILMTLSLNSSSSIETTLVLGKPLTLTLAITVSLRTILALLSMDTVSLAASLLRNGALQQATLNQKKHMAGSKLSLVSESLKRMVLLPMIPRLSSGQLSTEDQSHHLRPQSRSKAITTILRLLLCTLGIKLPMIPLLLRKLSLPQKLLRISMFQTSWLLLLLLNSLMSSPLMAPLSTSMPSID